MFVAFMSLHNFFCIDVFFLFYCASRSCLKFEFVLNSNEFANYKRLGNWKGFPFLYFVVGQNPASFLSPAQQTSPCPLSREAHEGPTAAQLVASVQPTPAGQDFAILMTKQRPN
jgi:hypothetical protein